MELLLIVAASALKLWLAAARTVTVIGWAEYDDRLFIRLAHSIVEGHWFGPYDHLTLIKGPVYPLWIALVSFLGMPLLFAQQVLYVVACLTVYGALAKAIRSPFARVALFVAVLFNPITFCDEVSTRIMREGIYSALALFIFAGVAGVVLRLERPCRVVLPWVLLAGVAFTLFWHTREEGIWMLPLLVCGVAIVARWAALDPRARAKRVLAVLILPALIFGAGHGAFVAINGLEYGAFTVVEFRQESFLRAYASLTHVHSLGATPPPVPRAVRERIYAVSPAFAELRPFLEGDLGKRWIAMSHLRETGDLGEGAFMWAFRDAVAAAGYYARGGRAVKEYYDRLAREIDAARRDGRLAADPARASMMPPITRGQIFEALRTWIRGCLQLPRFRDFGVTPGVSVGTKDELRQFAAMTNSPLAPPERTESLHFIGWVLHVDGGVDISIQDASRSPIPEARVIRLPSPDVYNHFQSSWKAFPPARTARFDVTIPSDAERAFMVLSLRGSEIDRLSLAERVVPKNPDVRMAIDKVERTTSRPAPRSVDALRLRIMNAIGRAYQWLFPPFMLVAALLYVGNLRRLARKRGGWTMPILVAGLVTTIAARVMILALIQVTSFMVMYFMYESPMYPLLIVAAVLMAHDGVLAMKSSVL